MIKDSQNEFDPVGTALTVTRASTNIIDLGVERDVGGGIGSKSLEVDFRVGTAFTAGGAATLTIGVETATDAAFTTPVLLDQSTAVPVASLIAGFEPWRPNIPSPTNRYVRIKYTVATGPMTAGTLAAALVIDRQANRMYASGIPAQA